MAGDFPDLWERVDALIDRARSDDDLRAHGLQVLAARRFRELGRAVPPDFVAAQRRAAMVSMAAPLLLERIAAAHEGPFVLLKGPEVAATYEQPELRGFADLDLLTLDPQAAQQALLDVGFEPLEMPDTFRETHHLWPLGSGDLPLSVEIHFIPKWIDGVAWPPVSELFDVAVPGTTGVPRMLRLPAAEQAVLLAVHGWGHEPLRRLRDLVDVAAALAAADAAEAEEVARRWNVLRIWRTTAKTLDAVFADERPPWALRIWGQNLRGMRERTVLENHLQRVLSDFWAMPWNRAVAQAPERLARELMPGHEERWKEKLARSGRALRNFSRARSEHERQIGV